MKFVRVAVTAVLCFPILCRAESGGEPSPRTAFEDLSGLSGEAPAKPESWISPHGGFVLHGDLFLDGRHLAILEEGDKTLLAEARAKEWRRVAAFDVAPAWEPADGGRRYAFIHPGSAPFVLRDLDGDKVPEILIQFDDDGYKTGFRMVRKQGEGARLLAPSSVGEPKRQGAYLVTFSATGRKAWGGGSQYYRWTAGRPVCVATEWEDVRDPENTYGMLSRYEKGTPVETFCLREEGDGWKITRCSALAGCDLREERPFVTVHFIVLNPDGQRSPANNADLAARQAYLFQKLTGLDWKVRHRYDGNNSPVKAIAREFARFEVGVTGDPRSVEQFKSRSAPEP